MLPIVYLGLPCIVEPSQVATTRCLESTPPIRSHLPVHAALEYSASFLRTSYRESRTAATRCFFCARSGGAPFHPVQMAVLLESLKTGAGSYHHLAQKNCGTRRTYLMFVGKRCDALVYPRLPSLRRQPSCKGCGSVGHSGRGSALILDAISRRHMDREE